MSKRIPVCKCGSHHWLWDFVLMLRTCRKCMAVEAIAKAG